VHVASCVFGDRLYLCHRTNPSSSAAFLERWAVLHRVYVRCGVRNGKRVRRRYPDSATAAKVSMGWREEVADRFLPGLLARQQPRVSVLARRSAMCTEHIARQRDLARLAHPPRVILEIVRRWWLLIGGVALFDCEGSAALACAWSWRMDLGTRMLTASLLQMDPVRSPDPLEVVREEQGQRCSCAV
jgi:hypothetical protein